MGLKPIDLREKTYEQAIKILLAQGICLGGVVKVTHAFPGYKEVIRIYLDIPQEKFVRTPFILSDEGLRYPRKEEDLHYFVDMDDNVKWEFID